MNKSTDQDIKKYLQNAIEEKCSKIDDAVTHFTSLQDKMLRNADQLKQEIRSNIEHFIYLLRTREQELLGETDRLSYKEISSVYSHLKELNYARGMVDVYKHRLMNDEFNPALASGFKETAAHVEKVINDTDKTARFPVEKAELMDFIAEPQDVVKSIRNFGHMKPYCIPSLSAFEEYNTIQLPPKSSEANGCQDMMPLDEEAEFDFLHLNDIDIKPNDRVDSLNRLSLDAESFDSYSADSIVMISSPGSEHLEEQDEETTKSYYKWLKRATTDQLLELLREKAISSSENAYMQSKASLSMWLHEGRQSESTGKLIIPEVTQVCRANETCNTLGDCLCDTNCALSQTRPFSNCNLNKTDLLIDPMIKILYGENNWLRNDENNKKLVVESSFPSESQASNDLKNWLTSESYLNSIHSNFTTLGLNDEVASSNDNSCFNSEWLYKKQLRARIVDNNSQVASMFERYFEPIDYHLWLGHGRTMV